jgi:hypothetical protein
VARPLLRQARGDKWRPELAPEADTRRRDVRLEEDEMRRFAPFLFCAVLVLAALPAAADHPGSATSADLQRLQDDLVSLDHALEMLETAHPRYRELQGRAEEIREEVIYVKVQVRRHQRDAGTPGPSRQDVEDLRRDINALHNDIEDQVAGEGADAGEGVLEAGTDIQVRLEQTLSSKTARLEDRVEGTVAEPVRSGSRVVIPVGTRVRGVVQAAEAAERPSKAGRLDLRFDTLTIPGSPRMDIRTSVVSIKEDTVTGDTAKKAGMGALLGAVLGKVVGGTEGAIIGLVVGAGGAIAATKGDDVELPEGSVLTLRLERPLTVRR